MLSQNYPHICIDATCIVPNGKGATVYAVSLLKALQEINPPAQFTVLVRQEAVKNLQFDSPNWSVEGVEVKSSHLWHLFSLPRLLKKIKPNLLHILGEAAVGRLPVPYILSVHELPQLYRQYVGKSSKSLYQALSQKIIEMVLPNACRKAAHVLALSKSTASDLVKQFHLDPNQVSVAYPGVDERFFDAINQPVSGWCNLLPHPYLLTFATGDPREIPEQVMQAFGIITSEIPHHLIIAGHCPDWQKSNLIEAATQLGCREKLYFTGFVSDADLPVLYRNADVYVEISRYEGFGLQVCEAMATGTVVIASNVASLPEVVGQAGYLVSINDHATLADKLLAILNNPREAKDLGQFSQSQASQFTWGNCAEKTWKTMKSLINIS